MSTPGALKDLTINIEFADGKICENSGLVNIQIAIFDAKSNTDKTFLICYEKNTTSVRLYEIDIYSYIGSATKIAEPYQTMNFRGSLLVDHIYDSS